MRRPGKFRVAYWIVMLAGIGVALWLIKGMLGPYDQVINP